VAKFLLRTLEFAFYHLVICFVDRLSRLPRDSCPPVTSYAKSVDGPLGVSVKVARAPVLRSFCLTSSSRSRRGERTAYPVRASPHKGGTWSSFNPR
jgi:hypothetical protein